jgi:hypothetical protein
MRVLCPSSLAGIAIGLAAAALTAGQAKAGAAIKPCQPQNLTASAAFQGATGSQLGGVMVRNRAPVACTLPSSPVLYFRYSGGVLKPLQRGQEGSRVLLAPGERLWSAAQWSNWCAPTPHGAIIPAVVEVFLPGASGFLKAPLVGTKGIELPRCDSPGQPRKPERRAPRYTPAL